jgi:hypothetical protein
MYYFRVAVLREPAHQWQWETTWMTSVEAVIFFLVFYRCPPAVQLRVFAAPTPESLEAQLVRANHGELSDSWTAEQFLGAQRQELVEQAWHAAAAEVPDTVLHRPQALVGSH